MDPTSTITGDGTFDHILTILGALVTLSSAIASIVNAKIRADTANGKTVSKSLAAVGTIANVVAVNLDKATQLAGVVRGRPIVSTVIGDKPADKAPSEK